MASSSKIFWSPNTVESKSTIVEDEKWLLAFKESMTPYSLLTIKTGTREYGLEAQSKQANSEAALRRKFATLWPLRNSFSVFSLTDSARNKRSTTTRLIFDLDFLFSFFGNPAFTLPTISEKTLAVCEKWNLKYSGKPELCTSRSPISEYIEAAQHVVRRRNGDEITTKLIVIISTWHFTRDNEGIESPTIYPSDCTVQFKYSSTEFQSQNGEESLDGSGFSFDKNGLIFYYPVFVSLMKSAKFQSYIAKCVEHRANDLKTLQSRKRGLELGVEDEEEIEEIRTFIDSQPLEIDEEEEALRKKKPGRVTGAVKKFKVPSSPTRRPTDAEIDARLSRAVSAVGTPGPTK